MKIFNTLTRNKDEFKPITEGEVKIYACGPTVYNYVHFGNMRPVVVFDVLRRLFIELGYKVTFISNYTDIDDRIIKKADQLILFNNKKMIQEELDPQVAPTLAQEPDNKENNTL